MKRFTRTFLFSVIGLGASFAGLTDVFACGGRGGGHRGGYSQNYSQSYYHAQPVIRQQVIQQPVIVQQIPVSTQVVQQNQQLPPNGIAPQQTTNPAADPQMTALQLLGEMTGAETTLPERTSGFNPVGTWIATLPNSAVVQLQLQANGAFQWVALAKGKKSMFEGTFVNQGESLNLIRSNDQQKLDGTITVIDASSFMFKLTGMQDSGLRFSRR